MSETNSAIFSTVTRDIFSTIKIKFSRDNNSTVTRDNNSTIRGFNRDKNIPCFVDIVVNFVRRWSYFYPPLYIYHGV